MMRNEHFFKGYYDQILNQIINNNVSISFYITGNNTFYSNNFIGNAEELSTDGYSGSNFCDNGKVGNYWSSYNGSDRNWDGIGDTPYELSDEGFAFGVDNYPLMSPVELSDGYGDLPLWAYEKLVALNLIEEPTQETTSEPFPTVPIAASAALAVAVGAGLVVYFKKRKH